jgi:DNA repair protein RecO (recombination protein O)
VTTPRVYKTEAIVLKRVNVGEADKILTLYTPNLGKLSAVARGVRRPKSKLGGHLELFTHSSLMLARGQNLDTISQAETITSFMPLREDLWRSGLAFYAVELVHQFTAEHLENYLIYRLLLDTLHRLCQTQDGELALRYFELNLLTHLGYRPELHHCPDCGSPLEPTTNYFSVMSGGVLCPQCRVKDSMARRVSVNALKVMRFLQESDYQKASRLKLEAELSSELQGLTRQYIRYLLEREMKTVAWLDSLRRER